MRLRILTALALLLAFAAGPALSHPHVWVDAASELVFDDAGEVVAVRHHWRFDEAFSAYALQGLDIDRDGTYSAEELKPLAQENVESLSDFGFFTLLSAGDVEARFAAPADYYLELYDDRLLLHFTLPLAAPLKPSGAMVLEVYDPEYFVAFSLPNEEAVRLVDAPQACKLTVYPAQELDADAAAALATIGADQRELPPEMKALTAGVENSAEVDCGGSAAPQSAADAAARMAQSGGEVGDLTALPAETTTEEPSAATTADEAPSAAPSGPSLSARLMARITAWQTAFNRDLTASLKALRDGGAFWWLGGISFLYGIVHAAGPGHGKVVISSYLVANEARVRRGVVIAFIAALAQAVIAVALIGVMAVILNMTSMAIDNTAKAFEAGSFALVAALGAYLLVRKGRETWALMRGDEAHSHDHGHGHHHSHGAHACHHHAAPIETKPGLSGAAAAVLSVGVRPCSGALVVLVFALAQGVFWAGIASTFLMALGTAITVAALAALAVGAKGIARRLARSGGNQVPTYVMLGLELVAALFITALGAVLFVATLSA